MMFDAARALIIHTTMHELYELHRCWLSINFRRLRHNPARGRDIMNSSNEARDGTADTQRDWLSASTDTQSSLLYYVTNLRPNDAAVLTKTTPRSCRLKAETLDEFSDK